MPAATTTNAARVNTYRQAEAVPFIVGTGRVAPKWISDRFNDHWSNGKMTGQAYCSIVGVLCHGPVDKIGAVFQGGAEIWNVNLTRSGGATYGSFSFGGPDSQFGPTYVGRIYYGTDEQTADAWLVAKTGQDHPPMRGMCYVVFERLHCGQVQADSRAQPAVPNIEFAVSRLPSPTIPASVRFPTSLDSEWWRGVNPVSALYDILTHPRAGLDCAEYLDTAAWAAAAQGIEDGSKRVFGADGLYARLSPLLTGGTDAESTINTFLEYFDGFVTSSNGLIGIDWFPNDGNTPSGLPTITQHDLAKVPEIDLSLLDDVPTSVAVTCLDYWAELSEAVESRNVPFTKQGRGDSSPKKLDRPWILDRDAAAEYAARQAALAATPDASGKLSVLLHRAVRADGSPLRPGDQFLLNYEPDSLLFICRVTEIEEPDDDDAVVELSFIREHGTSALPYVPEVDPRADYELPTPATPGADDWLVVETPPDIGDGKAIVLIRRSQQTLAGAEVEMDDDNAWAAGSSVLGSQGFAAWASLTADITDTATTCTISGTGVDLSPTLGSGRTTTEQADNTLLAYCGGEWLSIGAVTSVATDTYQLAILRGRLGIAATAHTSGDPVWIVLRAEIVQWSHALFTSEATRYFKTAYYHALETGTPSAAKALTFRESIPEQRWINLYTYNGYPLSSQYKPANTYIPSLGRGAKTLAECPLANWHESPAAAQSAYSASHGGSSPMDTVIPPFDGTASVEGSPLMYTCAGLVLADGSFVSLYGTDEWTAVKHYTPPIVTTKAVINNAGTFVDAITNPDTASDWTPKLVAGSTPIQLREAASGGLEYTTDEGETVNPMGGGASLPEATAGQILVCEDAEVGLVAASLDNSATLSTNSALRAPTTAAVRAYVAASAGVGGSASAGTTILTETWDDLSNWTTVGGSWSVASNILTVAAGSGVMLRCNLRRYSPEIRVTWEARSAAEITRIGIICGWGGSASTKGAVECFFACRASGSLTSSIGMVTYVDGPTSTWTASEWRQMGMRWTGAYMEIYLDGLFWFAARTSEFVGQPNYFGLRSNGASVDVRNLVVKVPST